MDCGLRTSLEVNTLAIFLSSLMYVSGQIISFQLIGIMIFPVLEVRKKAKIRRDWMRIQSENLESRLKFA